MDIVALLFTIGCLLISMIIAGVFGSKQEDKEWFKNLNHPDNAFLLKVINKYGLIFYLLLGFILYHLFVSGDIIPIAIVVIIIMLTGISPVILNKTKNLKLTLLLLKWLLLLNFLQCAQNFMYFF